MNRGLLLELHKYFTNISNPTKEEQDLLLRLNGELPYFHITSVHRDDLLSVGLNGICATDAQMERIARKMADDYCEQLFHISLPIIADYAGVPSLSPSIKNEEYTFCPKCESQDIMFDIDNNNHKCNSCEQEWSDIYVLVGFQDGDTSYFEDENIGYPCSNSEDNCARYVLEYEFILQYGKNPSPISYYIPVQWPKSQTFMDDEKLDDSGNSLFNSCDLSSDEKGLDDFGASSIWVPISTIRKE